FDDLRFSPQLKRVLAVPEGSARVFAIDPDSLEVKMGSVPGGSASVDASATTIYVADRGADQIVAVDATTFAMTAAHATTANPDYVRFSPTTPEVWVTIPSRDQIDILDAATLAPIDHVSISGSPEGLMFDGDGHALTQSGGRLFLVDVARRVVSGEWD